MRLELDDQALGNVTGGSIIFSPDHKTCGLNRNNQCTVNDYDACEKFIKQNMHTMSEQDMMRAMVSNGWITRIPQA